jgi:hypothetical protein
VIPEVHRSAVTAVFLHRVVIRQNDNGRLRVWRLNPAREFRGRPAMGIRDLSRGRQRGLRAGDVEREKQGDDCKGPGFHLNLFQVSPWIRRRRLSHCL